LLSRPWQYDRRVMHDRVTNKYSFEMNGWPINLVSLTPKQIYYEQLKLKKKNMVENERLYVRGIFFANKVLLGFDDDVIWLGTNFLTLEDVFYDIDSKSNLLKERKEDTNQVRSEFGLKIFVDQFCKFKDISQTAHRNELKFYREILDTWNYILINFQVKLSLEIYYFRWLKLLEKSCWICHIRPLCTI